MMKKPSGTLYSGDSIWKGVLITASILSCYFHPSAQNDSLSVVPNPPHGTVGTSVTLDIQGFSGDPFSYTWYRKTTEESNRLVAYVIPTGVQTPADIRERVFPNGSLLIPNLTLNDSDVYMVQISDSRGVVVAIARSQLAVYGKDSGAQASLMGQIVVTSPESNTGELGSIRSSGYPSQVNIYCVSSATAEESAGGGNGSSSSEGPIAGFMTRILPGVTLIGSLIYFLFFRKTEGASEHHLTENKSSAPSQSQTCSDSSPNKTEDASNVFLNFSAQNARAPSQTQTGCIYSEIKGKLPDPSSYLHFPSFFKEHYDIPTKHEEEAGEMSILSPSQN